MSTIPQTVVDDQELEQFGYWPRYLRTLRSFESFAIGFSFISITTGVFIGFGFVLNTAGPAGVWTWLIALVGQTLVALICATLAAKFPLSGYHYQWGTRLANPVIGWWLGWLGLTYLTVVVISVDYAFVQSALQPMLGLEYTPTSAALLTFITVAIQAALIIWSTPITSKINNAAVVFEVVGIVELAIVLLSAALLASRGDWGNLTSTGVVPEEGWFRWLGPFMLAATLGAYNLVGFESAANFSEETQDPRRVAPKAMIRAVVMSGVLGFILLATLAVAVGDVSTTSQDASPVAFVLSDVLGPSIEKIFLAFICVSIFCCGMICLATGSRLCWAMARDRRLPGHQFLVRVPKVTGGPTWATVAMAAVGSLILLVLRDNTSALIDLFTASTLSPALLYTGTVLLYARFSRRVTAEPGYFHLGRWERPVLTGAFVWLAYELIILFGPSQFRTAQTYVAGALMVGLVFFGIMWFLEPAAMRAQVVEEHGPDQPPADEEVHDAPDREAARTGSMW